MDSYLLPSSLLLRNLHSIYRCWLRSDVLKAISLMMESTPFPPFPPSPSNTLHLIPHYVTCESVCESVINTLWWANTELRHWLMCFGHLGFHTVSSPTSHLLALTLVALFGVEQVTHNLSSLSLSPVFFFFLYLFLMAICRRGRGRTKKSNEIFGFSFLLFTKHLWESFFISFFPPINLMIIFLLRDI